MLKAKKLILAGDPMQLPPTIISIDKPKKKGKQKESTNKTTSSAKGGMKTTSDTKQENVEAIKVDEPDVDDSDASNEDDSGDEELESDTPAPSAVNEVKARKSNERAKKREHQRGVLRPPRTLETTMFDRLEKMYGPSIKRMLTVQYRSALSFRCLAIVKINRY